ncbi:MAG TPA: carbohydrate kinase, partial [Candidatus Microbacterium pullistercoris]|nr:carbohydrate kinase [Candidatus Microbacterium pullistercoris]
MEALGMIDSIDVAADLVPVADVTRPVAEDAGVYAELLPVFERLYGALLPANVTLQDIASRLPLAH